MGVDIIVVNYRTPHDLSGFVRSLTKSRPKVPHTLTIVNVDPEQEDHSTAWGLMSENLGNWYYTFLSENEGYGAAINKAGSERDLPVVAAFNADTRITPGVVESCYYALMENKQWGVVGPKQVDTHGKITHGGIFGSFTTRLDRGFHEKNAPDKFCDTKKAVSVSGSAYFMKRELWNELATCPTFAEIAPTAKGPFLPTPHYYEETWVSYHAQAHGWDVMYYGEVCMTHKWHQASKVGGLAEQNLPISRSMFRDACDEHDIEHD